MFGCSVEMECGVECWNAVLNWDLLKLRVGKSLISENSLYEWMNEWMNGRMNGWINEWMNG